MKLIHTADIHLDTCFAGSGLASGYGNRRRQGLRDVFHGIIERARTWPADGLLIAGDLFELDRISRDTVAFLISEFQSITDVGVFIAPGNHDPYMPSSPYATETWPDNVHIFSAPEWSNCSLLDGSLVIHGFAFDGPDISSNPIGSLTIKKKKGTVHVAVGHGSERGHQPAEKADYAPFDAKDAAPKGLAYMALGHFHSLTHIEGPFETVMYYTGAPEGHGFREQGERYYLEVEIVDKEVAVKPVPSARLVYAARDIPCDTFVSSQDVILAVRAIAEEDDRATALRVTLTGPCASNITSELGAISDTLAQNFEFFQLLDQTEPQDDYIALARERTSLGAFMAVLNEEIDDAADDARQEMLVRAREVGAAAFRGRELDIRGLESG